MKARARIAMLSLSAGLVVSACFWFSSPAAGSDLDPKEQVEEFLGRIKAGKVEAAYESIFAASGLAKAKPQALEVLRRQTEAVLPLFGNVLGWELIVEEHFGNSLVRMVYLLKAEKHALTWEFYFYKPADKWFASQVTFDDQYRGLGPKVSSGPRPSA
jgi:hypothetical protein